MSLTDSISSADKVDVENPYKDLSIKELIQMGVEIRDNLREESRKFNQFEASAKGMIARVSQALKTKGDELGVDSFKTEEGTAYRNLKESYRVGSWDLILPYIIETSNWQMLEKRVAKLATKEIHKSTGSIPPGVEYIAEEEFVIRRPNERKGVSDE
jgi:hypothetical protein